MTSDVGAAAVERAEQAAKQQVKSADSGYGEPEDFSEAESAEAQDTQAETREPDLILPVLGFAVGGSLLGGERLVSRRQRRKLG
jgi:hypothetical protein